MIPNIGVATIGARGPGPKHFFFYIFLLNLKVTVTWQWQLNDIKTMPSRWSTRIFINWQDSPNLSEQFVLRNSKIYQLACNHCTVIHKEVQARMRQLQPKALYTHCRAHVLNLVILHNCKEPIVRTLIDIVQKMSFSFNYSAKELDQYQACLEQADPNTKECMGRRSKL